MTKKSVNNTKKEIHSRMVEQKSELMAQRGIWILVASILSMTPYASLTVITIILAAITYSVKTFEFAKKYNHGFKKLVREGVTVSNFIVSFGNFFIFGSFFLLLGWLNFRYHIHFSLMHLSVFQNFWSPVQFVIKWFLNAIVIGILLLLGEWTVGPMFQFLYTFTFGFLSEKRI